MGIVSRWMAVMLVLFLSSFSVIASAGDERAAALKPGDMVPDFTMPATNGFGQRLAEARGSFLMLIWLGRCDECSERLVRYQLLAESMALEGMKGWFVWTPRGDDRPPKMRLPVLEYDQKWRQSWLFEDRPAVMLINADGRLDHLITGDLKDNYKETEQVVMRWISQGRDYQLSE
ncbi:MAG: hypothetical protein VXZ05_08655 [Pseudomonadota bacterium]|nr:hypothetical protein [Pseudomonadota bacterium]